MQLGHQVERMQERLVALWAWWCASPFTFADGEMENSAVAGSYRQPAHPEPYRPQLALWR